MSTRILLFLMSCLLGLLLVLSLSTEPVRGDGKAKKAKNAFPRELEPKPFTLQGTDIPLSKALAELAKQTGNQVTDQRQGKEHDKLKLDLKNVTFWQALDAIAKASDARVSVSEREVRLALVDGPHLALPTCYSGLFRLVIKRVDATHTLDSDTHQCVLYVEVAWEPRFQPLLMETRPDDMVLRDDKGHDLEITEEEGKGLGAVGQRAGVVLQVRVPAPPRAAGHFSQFKGKLGAVGPTKMVTFTYDKLARIEKKEEARKEVQDGVTVYLRQLRPEQEGDEQVWTASLLLEYPADGPKFESFQSWLVNNEIYLEKEQDGIMQRFPPNLGYETGDQTDNKAIISYRFGDEPEKKLQLGKFSDWKLVYRTPGRITEIPIPFEFKDIPLP